MLNQAVLVGKVDTIEVKDEALEVVLIIEDERIPVTFTGSLADKINTYITKGVTLGIKAKVVTNNGALTLLVDKATFISPPKENE